METVQLNTIRENLKNKKVSQYRLAKDLDIAYTTVNRWCQNHNQPSLHNLFRVAAYLNVKPCDLLIEEIPKNLKSD